MEASSDNTFAPTINENVFSPLHVRVNEDLTKTGNCFFFVSKPNFAIALQSYYRAVKTVRNCDDPGRILWRPLNLWKWHWKFFHKELMVEHILVSMNLDIQFGFIQYHILVCVSLRPFEYSISMKVASWVQLCCFENCQ